MSEQPSTVKHDGQTIELKYNDGFCGTLGRTRTKLPFYTLFDAIMGAQRQPCYNCVLFGSTALSYTSLLLCFEEPKECFIFYSHSRNQSRGGGGGGGTRCVWQYGGVPL